MSPWRNRDFLLLWGGQTVSRLGSRLSDLALPLLVLALTGSPAQAGFIAATQSLSYLLLSLPAGALVDRWDRKRAMIACDAVRCLAFGSVPLAVALGRPTMVQFYAVALVAGAALAVFDAAELASLPLVVPPAQLARATGLTSSAEAASYLLGPGLAGLLIGLGRTVVAGAALAYLVDGISYLVSLLTLGAMRLPSNTGRVVSPRAALSPRTICGEIAEGVRFLWAQRRLRTLALLSLGLGLLDGPLVLAIIVLAQQELHAGAQTIGLVLSLAGAGEVLGSMIAPLIAARVGTGRAIVGAIAVWALATPLEAAAVAPLMLLAGAALADMMIPVYNVAQLSYRLALIPDALQGRVNSAYRWPGSAGGLLGAGAGGVLLAVVGPRPVLWIIAIGLGLCAAAAGLTSLPRQ